jgi:hypothetical protein
MKKTKLWRTMQVILLTALIASFGLVGCKQESKETVSEHPAGDHPNAAAVTDGNSADATADANTPATEHPAGEHPTGEHPQ